MRNEKGIEMNRRFDRQVSRLTAKTRGTQGFAKNFLSVSLRSSRLCG